MHTLLFNQSTGIWLPRPMGNLQPGQHETSKCGSLDKVVEFDCNAFKINISLLRILCMHELRHS